MATLQINGAALHYTKSGEGSETIVFSHGFLMSSEMFRYQIDQLSQDYQVIAYDHRGQGQSEVTSSGYDIDSYTDDAYQLITELCDGPVHFAGLSTGGFVGLRLAYRYPELIKSLILINTSAEAASGIKKFKFKVLRIFGRLFGLKLVIGQVMDALFGKPFLQDESRDDEKEYWKTEIVNNDIMGVYRSFDAAVYRDDVTDYLADLTLPVLIIGGELDKGLSPEESQHLDEHLPNSELVILDNVGHSSTIEAPEEVTAHMSRFLKSFSDDT